MVPSDAPIAFRIPISFERRSAVNAARPSRPRQETKKARPKATAQMPWNRTGCILARDGRRGTRTRVDGPG